MITPPPLFFALPRLTYLGHLFNNADASSYAFGNVVVPRSGLLIYGVGGRDVDNGALQWNSSTIAGNAATRDFTTNTNKNPCAIFSRLVDAGTFAVAAVANATLNRAFTDLWLLENYDSVAPVSTGGSDPGGSATSRSVTLDLPAGGVAISVSMSLETGAVSWTGATEQYDAFDGEARHSAADRTTDGALPGHVITATVPSSTEISIAGASWR
jgi:hypothetical protein